METELESSHSIVVQGKASDHETCGSKITVISSTLCVYWVLHEIVLSPLYPEFSPFNPTKHNAQKLFFFLYMI